MGEELDPEWPEIEPEKYYKATIAGYQDVTPKTGCDQELVGVISCCPSGAVLNQWINFGLECEDGWELCPFTGYTAQRLLGVAGPYDTFQACMLDI